MQRIIDLLDRTGHRAIVSMGPLHEELRLGERMYGEQFLPRRRSSRSATSLITHGGNNTVAEAFNFGLPVIVTPLFWDQYDNAQRVHETGFGQRLGSYDVRGRGVPRRGRAAAGGRALAERMKQISARADRRARPHQGRGSDRAARAHRRAGVGCMSFADSLWHQTAGESFQARAPLPGDIDVDVAIVGAGYTGLWTAYYLARADPSLRIVVLEREFAGFGASGRNGGWCSALFPLRVARARAAGTARDAAVRMQRAMHDTVDEVGRVADGRGHRLRLRAAAARLSSRATRRSSPGPASWWTTSAASTGVRRRGGLQLLAADEAEGTRAAPPACSAAPTPRTAPRSTRCGSCAGSPRAWRRRGVTIFERTTRVRRSSPASVRTDRGTVRAESSCARPRATRRACAASGADVVPLYSLMIATEPLPEEVWDQIGLRSRRDVRRPAAHAHLRPAHRRRPARVRRAWRAVPLRLDDPGRRSTATRACTRRCGEVLADLFPAVGGLRGHARVGRRARHRARLARLGRASTAAADSPGPAATSATAWPPRTSPAARLRAA